MYRTYIPAVPVILTIRSTTDANKTRTENKIFNRDNGNTQYTMEDKDDKIHKNKRDI